MACNNRTQHKIPPNTITPPCGNPLGFPSKLDLIAYDRDLYATIATGDGQRWCGDTWVNDATGARGVLSNDIVGNASEDPVLYAMAKRRYYKKRPTYQYKLNSIYNKPYFNEMTGESNYTEGELTNLPRNRSALMAGIGLASSPFDYPNESHMANVMPRAREMEMRPSSLSPSTSGSGGPKTISAPTNIPGPTNITQSPITATRASTSTPLPPDLTGGPMVPESGPGSTEVIDGYPTLNGDTGGGGGMPMGGGEEEVLEEEMGGLGGEKKYMGLTKKQGIIALILLVVAYYWWKNKKK